MIDFNNFWGSLPKESIDSLVDQSDIITLKLMDHLENKGFDKSTIVDSTAGWSGVEFINFRLPCEISYIDHFDFKREAKIANRTQFFCLEVCFRKNLDPQAKIKRNLNDVSVSIFFIERHQDSYIEKGFWKDQKKIIDTASILEMMVIPFRQLDNTEYSGRFNGVLTFETLKRGLAISQLMTALETKELLVKNSQKEIVEIIHLMISTVHGFISKVN